MIYYLTALINGFFNSINRMTNVRAGKLFGTANGALINYVEATVLSLLLMLVRHAAYTNWTKRQWRCPSRRQDTRTTVRPQSAVSAVLPADMQTAERARSHAQKSRCRIS